MHRSFKLQVGAQAFRVFEARTMRQDSFAFLPGRSGSLVARFVHCDESAWKVASALAADAQWCRKSLLRKSWNPKEAKSPATPHHPDNRSSGSSVQPENCCRSCSFEEVLGYRSAPQEPSPPSVASTSSAASSTGSLPLFGAE